MKIKLVEDFYYRVQDTDNEKLICQRFNTYKTNIKRNNNSIPQYAGEWIRVGVNDFKSHFVAPTETLTEIAKKYSLSKEKLIADNCLESERLYIGQRLKIYGEEKF